MTDKQKENKQIFFSILTDMHEICLEFETNV